jgi:DNA ligase-associated metallophosphoesterase
MIGYAFTFAGTGFVALGSGALFCPTYNALIIADLHLGKSERMARRGGALLPPFETRDTLNRLGNTITETQAKAVFLLGDVFDDNAARDALTAEDDSLWQSVNSVTECTMLSGNHDPTAQTEAMIDRVTLRHIAGDGPDISGHFHPKARLKNTARPAFLIGQDHIILPAFGTFTGGLDINDPVFAALAANGIAVLTGPRPIAFPFGKAGKHT